MHKELPACSVETTLLLIGDKWKVLILRELIKGTRRFGELKKTMPDVSQKILTQQLRSMEEDGLLTRKVYAEIPPRVEYTLTDTGKSLKIILDAMKDWGKHYKSIVAEVTEVKPVNEDPQLSNLTANSADCFEACPKG